MEPLRLEDGGAPYGEPGLGWSSAKGFFGLGLLPDIFPGIAEESCLNDSEILEDSLPFLYSRATFQENFLERNLRTRAQQRAALSHGITSGGGAGTSRNVFDNLIFSLSDPDRETLKGLKVWAAGQVC